MTTITGRDRLSWRKSAHALALHRESSRAPLLHVVRDATHPGMWCVRDLDGRLSEAANLTWAKDAAVTVALERLNRRPAQETAVEASSVRQNHGALGLAPRGTKALTTAR
jgi:hypothetical protein